MVSLFHYPSHNLNYISIISCPYTREILWSIIMISSSSRPTTFCPLLLFQTWLNHHSDWICLPPPNLTPSYTKYRLYKTQEFVDWLQCKFIIRFNFLSLKVGHGYYQMLLPCFMHYLFSLFFTMCIFSTTSQLIN